MHTDAQFLAIQEDIEYRFQPANPIAKAVSQKLCLTLYKQQHCEYWIDRAQSIPPQIINTLSTEDRVAFNTRLSKKRDQLRLLRRLARNYCIALSTTEPAELPDHIE